MVIKRGDIFYADLRPVVGSEQGGIRPVLIIQNDVGNRHSPTVICAAITSKMNKAKLPTHIEIDASDVCQIVEGFGDPSGTDCGRSTSGDSRIKSVILTRRCLDEGEPCAGNQPGAYFLSSYS